MIEQSRDLGVDRDAIDAVTRGQRGGDRLGAAGSLEQDAPDVTAARVQRVVVRRLDADEDELAVDLAPGHRFARNRMNLRHAVPRRTDDERAWSARGARGE